MELVCYEFPICICCFLHICVVQYVYKVIKILSLHCRYYPHHYAPYMSDVKDFSDLKIEFELSKPFLPFQQLMAVLPPASKNLLPKPLQVENKVFKLILNSSSNCNIGYTRKMCIFSLTESNVGG